MNFTQREKKQTFFSSGGPGGASLEGRTLGHYILRRLIGRGATGEVYLADDQRLSRQVAIKIILGEYLNQADAKEVARLFQREAQAIALLNHPNILPLFDFGEESSDGTTLSYLVIPFCPEGSLKEWLHRHHSGTTLSPQELLPFLEQAADALEYAHSNGIVHCDVKPSNFLIRSRRVTSDQPNLLLADFSVARLAQRTASISQTVRGTPSYMSPEQWQGKPVPASDQYALASMAYELLTGSPPFQGTLAQLMYHHLTTPPQPPSTITRGFPPALDVVMLQALAKQPEARFPSVTAFVDAFHQAVQNAAYPPAPQLASTSSPVSGEVIANTPVQLSPPAGTRDAPHFTSAPFLQAGDIHVTLHLSASEARAGGDRTLQLPSGQQAKVTVPAGACDGQVIRLPRYLESSSPLAQKKDLVVTITVTPTAGSAGAEPSQPSISHPSHPSLSGSAIIQTIPGLSPSRITWKTVSLIGLVLLLLLVGVVVLSPLIIPSSPMNGPNATATANADTGTAQAAQGTASAATATANAQATASAQASATATVVVNPYETKYKTLALNETLEKNSTSQWDETPGSCVFTATGYQLTSPAQATSAQVCVARKTNFSDMAFEVQMQMLSGSGGGLLVRASGSASYYFRLTPDGHYTLSVCPPAGTFCTTILTSGFSGMISQGLHQNLIAVVASGNRIELYVNRERIYGVNDSSSLYGQIGVVAEAGSQVVFSNARVWIV